MKSTENMIYSFFQCHIAPLDRSTGRLANQIRNLRSDQLALSSAEYFRNFPFVDVRYRSIFDSRNDCGVKLVRIHVLSP